MAQPLHDDHGHPLTTPAVLEEHDAGPATVLVVLIIAALLGFLIWLFAFSGVVFDNGGGGDTVNIEENTTTNDTGGAGTDTGTSGGTSGETSGTTSSP